jgi:hypothetical protein
MAALKRRWPGPEKAPFDRGGLMEWVSPHVARTRGTAPDGFGVPQEWRDNEPFRAVLTLTGIERGRSAARFMWHGGTMVGPTFTGTFPMFMVDACALLLRGEALAGGVRDGWWIIMKRGANYGVAAIDPPEDGPQPVGVVDAAVALAEDYQLHPSSYGRHPPGSPFATLMFEVARR